MYIIENLESNIIDRLIEYYSILEILNRKKISFLY